MCPDCNLIAMNADELFQRILDSFEREEYGKMSAHADKYLAALGERGCATLTIEEEARSSLAKFFKIFGRAYEKWQASYEYDEIREMFYCSSLVLERFLSENNERLDESVRALLNCFALLARALISYVYCENSIILNDARALKHYSGICVEFEQEAIRKVESMESRSRIINLLLSYVQKNFHLHSSLNVIASAHIDVESNKMSKEASEDILREVDDHMDALLDLGSSELYSELRAHREFMHRRLKEFRKRSVSFTEREGEGLRFSIREGEVRWMMSAFANPVLTEDLYNSVCHISTKNRSDVTGLISTRLGLGNILLASPFVLHDIFDTAIGRRNIRGFTVFFSPAYIVGTSIYKVEIALKFSLLGICSICMSTNMVRKDCNDQESNTSVSRIRTLQSLIAPHSGQVPIFWVDKTGHQYTEEEVYKIARNVPYPFAFEYLKYIEILAGKETKDEKKSGKASASEDTIVDLTHRIKQKLRALCLCHLNDDTDSLPRCRKEIDELLIEACDALRHIARAENKSESCGIASLALNQIQLERHSYANLRSIAQTILNRVQAVFQGTGTIEASRAWSIDPNRDWFSYLYLRSVTIDGRLAYAEALLQQSEFKGILIGQREARATLDDWMHVNLPEEWLKQRNLATIRSHAGDLFWVDENHAIIYLPDDPQYLVDQYAQTIEVVSWIRCMMRAFDSMAEEMARNALKYARPDRSLQGRRYVEAIQRCLDSLELLRMESLETLHILLSCEMSRYQDHGRMMAELLRLMNLPPLRSSLEHRMDNILRLEGHLEDRWRLQTAEDQERRDWILMMTLGLMQIYVPLMLIFQFFEGYREAVSVAGIALASLIGVLAFLPTVRGR